MNCCGICKNGFIVVINFCYTIVGIIARRFFQTWNGGKGKQVQPIKDPILLDSATTIAYKIRSKKITSVEVLNSYINRIKEVNPLLNCVVANRFEDALKEAQEVDNLIKSDTMPELLLAENKPFLGVPFTTKDSIAIKDMILTAGLYKRRNVKAAEDADPIANLRNAGAIPIALTNVPEMCTWWESSNALYGRTSNPYDINRTAGGSSGGEGSIQAAAGSAFGVGSDIGGSIRIPSCYNGVFGHKPSKSIISNAGQFPVTVTEVQNNMLCVGPMCRHAEDLLPLLKVMVKNEDRNKLKLDEKVELKSIKFYYQKSCMDHPCLTPVEPEIIGLFKKVVSHLDTVLKIKAEEVKIDMLNDSGRIWCLDMVTNDNGPTFGQQLCDLKGTINLRKEIFKWCFGRSKHTFVALLFAAIEKCTPASKSEIYKRAMDKKKLLLDEMVKLLGNDGVLIFPTHPTAALYHRESIFKAMNFVYTASINLVGFPATHCPLGLNSDGLPIGLQVISNVNNDRLCLAVAMELEKAFGGWVSLQART